MRVGAKVEPMSLDGCKLRFRVECGDDQGVVGTGFREKSIIDHEKLLARLAAKQG